MSCFLQDESIRAVRQTTTIPQRSTKGTWKAESNSRTASSMIHCCLKECSYCWQPDLFSPVIGLMSALITSSSSREGQLSVRGGAICSIFPYDCVSAVHKESMCMPFKSCTDQSPACLGLTIIVLKVLINPNCISFTFSKTTNEQQLSIHPFN